MSGTSTGKRPQEPLSTSRTVRCRVVALFLFLFVTLLAFSFIYHDASDEYAVCSSSKHIYTVDESNPRVRCIIVHGSRIVYTGSLGGSFSAHLLNTTGLISSRRRPVAHFDTFRPIFRNYYDHSTKGHRIWHVEGLSPQTRFHRRTGSRRCAGICTCFGSIFTSNYRRPRPHTVLRLQHATTTKWCYIRRW